MKGTGQGAGEDRAQRLQKKAESNLIRLIEHDGLTPAEAYQQILEEYEMLEVGQSSIDALNAALDTVQSTIQNIERITAIRSLRSRREPWYAGPRPDDSSWNAYRSHLEDKGWSDTIPSIDDSSTSVVSLLDAPGLSRFSCRGLVLGYVQSGKTANMTAVIAKAVDSGYRLVIVLTGMIEKLRQQTQLRLESDLLNHEGSGQWEPWTTSEDDFRHPTTPGFQFNIQNRNIMIIKKNASVLRRILEKLENTSSPELQRCPVLVIDDECDQASVNAPTGADVWKTINRQVRQLLEKFPRAAYVGYTATPFANVLIDPEIDPDKPDDLYPRDFIFSLPRPANYFGAERLFGRDMLSADDSPGYDEELDLIRQISAEEAAHYRNLSQDADVGATISVSLEEAIDYFILATAIRNLRGQRAPHSTMLIHTSQRVDAHWTLYSGVQERLSSIRVLLQRGDQKYKSRIEDLFARERAAVPPELFGHTSHSFDDIWGELLITAEDTEVVVENSTNPGARIDYEGAEKGLGRRYICIGGNVLARGLTLEGLVSSFFIRTASQYDTLMQMGRWFGYRVGYEDLPRVWMPVELSENFTSLATVEADIRYQIEVYQRTEITPSDLAVKIRKIPGLAITARNKMLAARVCNLSFSGQHRQTFRFYHKDPNILGANLSSGATLLEKANERCEPITTDKGFLFRSVDRRFIESFLNDYRIHESHVDLIDDATGTNHLLEYIDSCKSRDPELLKSWNVALIQTSGTSAISPDKIALGPLDGLSTISRSRFQGAAGDGVDIKALMSRRDLTIDLPQGVEVKDDWDKIKKERYEHPESSFPLLLLYLINKDSKPVERKSTKSGGQGRQKREPLEAVDTILGFGIVFPSIEEASDPSYHVSVRLPDPDDALEAVLEEEEQV